jgi:hypothetical protein
MIGNEKAVGPAEPETRDNYLVRSELEKCRDIPAGDR